MYIKLGNVEKKAVSCKATQHNTLVSHCFTASTLSVSVSGKKM